MNLKEKDSMTWRARAAIVALAAAVLVTGIGADAPGTAAAKGRPNGRKSQLFTNSTRIEIASNAQAAPSTIAVSGLDAPIVDVDVSLGSLTHPTASDLDIMLVSPGGQATLLMSDTGGDAQNDSLTFSDQATERVTSEGSLVSGVFQPTNDDYTPSPDIFTAPAPATSSGSALSIFNGGAANGTWTLFIREQDNVPPQTGRIENWSLRIVTANGAPTTAPDSFQAQAGKTLTVPAAGVLQNDSDPDNDALTAILAGQPRQGEVELAPDGSFTYRAKKKSRGADTFTYLARDDTGLSTLETVNIQIKDKKGKKGKRR